MNPSSLAPLPEAAPPVDDSGTAVLEVRGARRQLGRHPAIAGVDLAVARGEIYALLGANGAGKTSLLRAISGRLALDAGSIRVAGRDPRRDREARRALGVVPQQLALYPQLSARQNLSVFGRLAGVARRGLTAKVERALDRVGLAARGDDRVAALSGGMQRRLNIVAGTLHEPLALVLDEPTVGVDLHARQRIHDLLRDLRGDGLGILLATHDLEQANVLADRVGILARGRVCAEGAPRELIEDAFGDAQELTVTLGEAADASGRRLLAHEGLAPLSDGMTWERRLERGMGQAAALGARLAEAGLTVASMRVRAPTLASVVLRWTGEELEP